MAQQVQSHNDDGNDRNDAPSQSKEELLTLMEQGQVSFVDKQRRTKYPCVYEFMKVPQIDNQLHKKIVVCNVPKSGNIMGICGAMYSTTGSVNQKYHMEHAHSEIWAQSEQQRIGVNNVDSGDIELQEEEKNLTKEDKTSLRKHKSKIADIEAEWNETGS